MALYTLNVVGGSELRVCLLVVLYKLDPDQSSTLKSIHSAELLLSYGFDVSVVVWDNSAPLSRREEVGGLIPSGFEFHYFQSEGNESLARIYNTVIKLFSGGCDYIGFYDHDSCLSEEYFHQFQLSENKYSCAYAFAPKIYVGTRLVSPGKRIWLKGYYVNDFDVGVYKKQDWLVINSGLIVRLKYFSETSNYFDERLGFYSVDSYFSIKFQKSGYRLCVFDGALSHSLSLYEDESLKKKLWRFEDRMSGMYVTYGSGQYKYIVMIYLLSVASLYAVKNKSLSYYKALYRGVLR